MAESNSPRLGLRRWTAGTDTPSRVEFDTAHAILDDLAAIDRQDVLANRPTAAVRGTYFYDIIGGILYRDTGAAWTVVGSRVVDAVSTASGTSSVPITATGLTGHTAALLEAKVATTVRASILADGTISGTGIVGKHLNLAATAAGTIVMSGKASPGHTADMLSLTSSDDASLFKVKADGSVETAFLSAASGRAIVGAPSASNATGMSLFAGIPAFEVRALGGGSGATFTDFLYLKHQAADATAAPRRLGVVMKVGDEIPGDASKTGGVYIESNAALFANPKLVLMRADAPVMQFPATGFGSIEQSMTVNGQLALSPGTANPSLLVGTARLGVQGNELYLRAGSGAGFYLYAGGNHSSTPGDAGGGSQLGRLDPAGVLTVNKLRLLAVADASHGQAAPTFQIGAASSTNLILDDSEVMARNNGAASDLLLNADGGGVQIGGATSFVSVPGRLSIGGRKLTISTDPPGGPAVGDVWIDI